MKNIDKYNSNIINILSLFFPLSLIMGNLLINLNIFLLCVSTFIFYKKTLVKFKLNFLDKIILVFFTYTLLVLVINFSENYFNGEIFPVFILYKTLLFLRYCVLYFVIRFLISQNILKIEWFSFACAGCAAFVCLDIFFQFYFGNNLFGIEPVSTRHNSGVFGDELIAGGYLQRFGLFFFFLPFILKKKLFYKISFQFIFFIIFLLGIALSGNRMPFVLFVFSFFVLVILNKELRKYFLSFFIVTFLIFTLVYKLDHDNGRFKVSASTFYYSGKNLVNTFFIDDITKEPPEVWQRPYALEFFCFKHIWKKNPIFGGGVRSYRTAERGCNTHPHNYYFEILSDLGIVGFGIVVFFVFSMLHKMFIRKNTLFQFSLTNIDAKIMPFFLVFLVEFFPLRSSGSFFTTNNAAIIFIILAALVSLISERKVSNY